MLIRYGCLTFAYQSIFIGLQVPQANLPTVVNGHDATNSATISGMSTPAIPSSLMMSVMSMMSEKLKAGGLINKVNQSSTYNFDVKGPLTRNPRIRTWKPIIFFLNIREISIKRQI